MLREDVSVEYFGARAYNSCKAGDPLVRWKAPSWQVPYTIAPA